ncbi:response regulator [Tellurirhabdus bombi]|uniref:response regulator n=1 Tax=Tellurirhabdus bombi TaxID=2907205 RepID=UPI001F384184|nr:response regulator [Tellurirhabdus bombi]
MRFTTILNDSTALKRKLYVALIDDDEDDRQFLAKAFQNIGSQHEFVEFEDGEQFLDSLKQESQLRDVAKNCSLIILDVNMHRIGGFEVLQIVKSNSALKHIPVIMLSTSIEGDQVQKAYKKGANSYLQKPHLMDDYNHLAVSIQTCFLQVPCV